jgi:hypothetical protein
VELWTGQQRHGIRLLGWLDTDGEVLDLLALGDCFAVFLQYFHGLVFYFLALLSQARDNLFPLLRSSSFFSTVLDFFNELLYFF